jgi:hypothetical protein
MHYNLGFPPYVTVSSQIDVHLRFVMGNWADFRPSISVFPKIYIQPSFQPLLWDDKTVTFKNVTTSDSVLSHISRTIVERYKGVGACVGSVTSQCFWLSCSVTCQCWWLSMFCGMSVLMAIHAHTKFKVKINVTVCQTINELTDWGGIWS